MNPSEDERPWWSIQSLLPVLGAGVAIGFLGGLISALVVVLVFVDFQSIAQITSTISALASMLLVTVTGVYAYLTYGLVKETQEAREQDIAPVISFSIREQTPGIANVGNGPAAHVEISITTHPDGEVYEYTVAGLRPGEFRGLFGEPSRRLNVDSDSEKDFVSFTVEGTCQDGFGNEWPFEWEYDVDPIRKELRGDTGFLAIAQDST